MDFRKTHAGGGYGSEFESDAEEEKKKRLRQDLAIKDSHSRVTGGLPSKRVAANEYDREESKNQRFHFLALDAYNRHKQLVNDYILYYPGATKDLFQRDTSKDKTDLDVIRENHRFLWSAKDEQAGDEEDWGKQLAKKYWDKLFKEYCIADLSRYKENKIAMRWRVEKEVVEGKGHFTCGNKRCGEQSNLRTWEVNFGYMEHGEKKNALVKLRLCERCSYKLNYTKKCKEVTRNPSRSKMSIDRDRDSSSPQRHKSKHKARDEDSDKVKHKDSDKVRHKDSDKVKHKDSNHKVRHKDSHKRRHKDKDKKRDDDDDDDRESRRRKRRHHHKEKRHRKRSSSRSRRSGSSSRSEESADDEDDKGLSTSRHASADDSEKASVSEGDFWTGPAPVVEEKSREDEMDDFLKDIFL